MMRLKEYYTPELPLEGSLDLKAEYDRLYLEKCQEVNRLEQSVDSYRNMAEVAIKQKGELRDQLDECKKTIRELAAEQLPFGFFPDAAEPEPLPEELMEELPLWSSQAVSSQDILCLSSALKNLYDIHKCDSWLLYNKLSKVLEKKIEEYSGED